MAIEGEVGFEESIDRRGRKTIRVSFKNPDRGNQTPIRTATHVVAFLPLKKPGDCVKTRAPSKEDAQNLKEYLSESLTSYGPENYRQSVMSDGTYALRRVT